MTEAPIASPDTQIRANDSPDLLLRWLQAAFVSAVRNGADDLTMRQLAVMLITYQDSEPQTVRGLAQRLKVSRPAISRALDRLGEFGITRRQKDPHDRRSVTIRRTRKGAERMKQLFRLLPKFPDTKTARRGASAESLDEGAGPKNRELAGT